MHAQRALFEMRTITDFGLHESSDVTLGGQPAARIRYSYATKDGRLEQCQTYAIDPLDTSQIVSILTTARVVDLPAVKPIFDARPGERHLRCASADVARAGVRRASRGPDPRHPRAATLKDGAPG